MKEKFQGDLAGKLRKDLISLDFALGTCSCNSQTKKISGNCSYQDRGNTPIVVYKATCTCCDTEYVGGHRVRFGLYEGSLQ